MSHVEFAACTFGAAVLEPPTPVPVHLPMPAPGETLAVIGPSGAGKTLALNALAARCGGVHLPVLRRDDFDLPVLELFPPLMPGETVLRNLARVGLADGRLWRLQVRHLSAGEQQRLRIALWNAAVSAACGRDARAPLIADEFDAHLDELTACAIAQTLRRLKLPLVVSTHNLATLPYLAPARVFEIDRGMHELPAPAPASLADEIEIVPARVRDWDRFKHWHYLGQSRPGPSCAVWLARLRGREAGIVMFGYPHLLLSARKHALPECYRVQGVRAYGPGALNRDVRLLQRVVVDPRLRGLGIAARLIEHGVRALGVPYVECVAQMGTFSDFLLRAGFEHVCALEPPKSAAALLRFCERRDIPPRALADPALRETVLAAMQPNDREALARHLRALEQSRINTGHGCARESGRSDAALNAALARLGARPEYFLWSRESQEPQ
jgi:energy-coupling factor transporter ATP-binding protein EcfA2